MKVHYATFPREDRHLMTTQNNIKNDMMNAHENGKSSLAQFVKEILQTPLGYSASENNDATEKFMPAPKEAAEPQPIENTNPVLR